MLKKVFTLFAEIIISLGIAWAADFMPEKPKVTLLIAAVIFFAIEHVRLRVAVEESGVVSTAIAESIKSAFKPDEFAELRLIYGLRNLYNMSRGSIKVDKGDVFDFWSDSLTRTRTRWQALSYIKSWSSVRLQKLSHRIQAERIEGDVEIERIFIVDSEEEKGDLESLMKEQYSVGIDVGYLFVHSLPADADLIESRSKIDSLDFAIVDDRWVYITYLGPDRQMTSAGATNKQEILEAARRLFIAAKERAEVLK